MSNVLYSIKALNYFCYLTISTDNCYMKESVNEYTILCPWYKHRAHIYLVIRDLL